MRGAHPYTERTASGMRPSASSCRLVQGQRVTRRGQVFSLNPLLASVLCGGRGAGSSVHRRNQPIESKTSGPGVPPENHSYTAKHRAKVEGVSLNTLTSSHIAPGLAARKCGPEGKRIVWVCTSIRMYSPPRPPLARVPSGMLLT